MTIVCAITDGETTWIGSDRQSTLGGELAIPTREGKWVELPSGWWVGCSGWARTENLAAMCVEQSYDAEGLARRIREFIREDGWDPEKLDAGPTQHNVSQLLAKPGEVWGVDAAGWVSRRPDHELAAIGAGSPCALGAAYALQGVVGHRSRLASALKTACRYEPSCGHGLWTEELSP